MIYENAGDVFTTRVMAIGHGCNCRGQMGAGIAKQIKQRYRVAFDEYSQACASGTFRPGCVQLVKAQPHWILNMATQDAYGPPIWKGGRAWAKAEWIEQCLNKVTSIAEEHEIRSVAFPRVGCNLGGLFWDRADYAEKRNTWGVSVGPEPKEGEFVRSIFVRAFEAASFDVELWTFSS